MELIQYLEQFITENKRQKIQQVLEHRTRYLTVVVEDIYQPHNASAVVRTCDCFGIQELHIIENRNKYKVNPDVTLGSSKWVDIIKHNQTDNNTVDCISKLKEQGYRIVATTPHEKDYDIYELPLDNKIALLFGTEAEGLSKTALDMADDFVKIPMYGFTESLNISVSAAICIHHLIWRLNNSKEILWKLSEEEKAEIRLRWVRNIIQRADLLEKEFFNKKDKKGL